MLASGRPALLLACLFLGAFCVADFVPDIKSTVFPNEPFFSYLDNNVIISTGKKNQISLDNGDSWNIIAALKDTEVYEVLVNPDLKSMALVLTEGHEHFITTDSGKTWKKFAFYGKNKKPLTKWSMFRASFNSGNSNYISLEFLLCGDEICQWVPFVTKDAFKTVKTLPEGFSNCLFPRKSADFAQSVKPETMLCSKEERNSRGDVLRTSLHLSEDFFSKSDTVVEFPGSKDKVIRSMRVESAFLLIELMEDKFGKGKSSFMVSKDLKSFDISDLSPNSNSLMAWFISASPSRLVFVDSPSGSLSLGSKLYISDSTGLKFTPVVEAGIGIFEFSKSSESIVYSLKETSKGMISTPHFRCQMSFDSGKTWQRLEVLDDPDCELKSDCSLHTNSIGNFAQTPHILTCNGLKGKEAELFSGPDGDLYVSRDGGASWTFALKGSYETALLDQGNIIVAYKKSSFPISEIQFSLDQGRTWSSLKLDQVIAEPFFDMKPESSESRVYFFGFLENEDYTMTVFDFKNAFDGAKCSASDLEPVPVLALEGHPEFCYNGLKDTFNRRKQDAKCLVDHPTEAYSLSHEPCECTQLDYECSPDFKLSAKQVCVPNVVKIAEKCQGSGKKIKLPSYRKIDGNKCVTKKKESEFTQEVEINCKDIKQDHKENQEKANINVEISKLEGTLKQYSYVKSTNFSDNFLLLTSEKTMFASNNGGQSLVSVPLPDDVLYFLVGAVDSTAVIVTEKYLYYSQNGGNTFTQLEAPERPNSRGLPIVFDPSEPGKFIFIADDATTGGLTGSQAYYTEDAGLTFHKLLDNVLTCAFVEDSLGLKEDLLYCTVADGQRKKLVSSKNYFKDQTELFDNVLAFALKPGFVFVALVADGSQSLKAKVTVDGVTFADTEFPKDFQLDKQMAYTILDSASHSILMHMTTDRTRGKEKGALLKSNSNGTSYVLALDNVNRNTFGFVDFDRIDILEGTYIANTVSDVIVPGSKKLKTRISHNDGGIWEYLVPPRKDSNGKEYECVKSAKGKNSLEKCSLNLRSFTERPDYKDTFSSTSAVGYLFGVGNVGEFLGDKDLATFMSADGGVTWKEIVKGAYMWEFGDHGTILVLVKEKELTQEILYSTDDGKSWKTFKFSDTPVHVLDLATVPEDTSQKFIILADSRTDIGMTVVISIDFTNFFPRQCQLDLDHPLDDDYDYWTPNLPGSSNNCIFGHVSKYLRRAEGHNDCFIGAAPFKSGIDKSQNCACTVKDYECDYNFYRDIDGTCKLVAGLSPQDHKKQMCSKPDTFQFFEPTGYRKLPSSTCVGGKQLDSYNPQACPGHGKEFNEKYGRNMSFGKFIVLLVVPLAAFFGATWFVYERGVKRNGGIQRLGQIRLEEANDFDPIEDNNVDKVVNGIVKGGIYVVAGTIATFKLLRKLDRKMLENVTGLLFGRRPGRRNYVRVPDDEDELFGDYDDNLDDENDLSGVDFHVDDDPTDLGDDFDSPQAAAADANLFDIDDEPTAESGNSDIEH